MTSRIRVAAVLAALAIASAAAAQGPAEPTRGDRLAGAAGQTTFAAWRLLDLLSFRILEPLARIIDRRDASDPSYGGEEGRRQFRREYVRIVFTGRT